MPSPTQVPVPVQRHKRPPSDTERESVTSPPPEAEDSENRESPSGKQPMIDMSKDLSFLSDSNMEELLNS